MLPQPLPGASTEGGSVGQLSAALSQDARSTSEVVPGTAVLSAPEVAQD